MENASYPKWKYHAEKAACIVYSSAEEQALGAGWCESPVEVSPVKSEPEPIKVELVKKSKVAKEGKEPKA